MSADGAVVLRAPREARAAYSRDGGKTWVPSVGLPEPAKVPDWAPWFLRLASDRVNPQKLSAFDALGGVVYASEDGGAHFTATSRSLRSMPDYELHFVTIQTVPEHEGDVWITTKEALAHSTDSAKKFKLVRSVVVAGCGSPESTTTRTSTAERKSSSAIRASTGASSWHPRR